MNALTRGLESAFVRERVPYQIVRGLAFFDRKENKDVIAYLRLLINPRDEISFLRVVNEPVRGIGKTSLEHLMEYAEPREMSLRVACAATRAVRRRQESLLNVEVHRAGCHAGSRPDVLDAQVIHFMIITVKRLTVK